MFVFDRKAPAVVSPPAAKPRAHAPARSQGELGPPLSSSGDAHEVEARRLAERVTAPERSGGSGRLPASLPVADGDALPTPLRSYFEGRFGADLGQVRLHVGRGAAESAAAIGARAFTSGHHVSFGAGQYRPETGDGRQLLAHELAHVVQVQSGRAPAQMLHRDEEAPAPAPAPATTTFRLSGSEVVLVKEDARHGQAEIREAPATYASAILRNAGLDPVRWFKSFRNASFLGQTIEDPIHTDLATHLAAVERTLADKYGGPGKDPAVAGTALGLRESIKGSRESPTSARLSMHLFGLAVDINYVSNPFISSTANDVFERAGQLVDGTGGRFKHDMSYDELAGLDATLETYLSYLDDEVALEARLDAAAGAPWAGMTVASAKKQIEKDLKAVARKWQRAGKTDVIKATGFLDLRKELVAAMGLSWGASYGDIMHFDMRNKGNGAKIQAAIGAYQAEKEAESRSQWTAAHPK
jgi:hypothetical protein